MAHAPVIFPRRPRIAMDVVSGFSFVGAVVKAGSCGSGSAVVVERRKS